jgi:putative GTP pyrophosphokinase
LAPDRFGYLSLHYVVSLSHNRAILTEYKKCAGIKAEIQVRSILQHAWAEIEHKLGYRSEVEVPGQIRRAFARVSGLLELSDQEFIRIRQELVTYSSQVERQVRQKPQAVGVDRDSIKSYIESSELVNRLDADVAEMSGALPVYALLDDILSLGTRACIAAGITTIYQLNSTLEELADRLPSFVKRYFGEVEIVNHAITRGACIFFGASAGVGRATALEFARSSPRQASISSSSCMQGSCWAVSAASWAHSGAGTRSASCVRLVPPGWNSNEQVGPCREGRRKSGSHLTPCWREMDSNFQFRDK